MLRAGEVTDALIQDLGEGLDTFFRPGSVTPTTPLVSPTSDDCSSLSFQADGSPNHDPVRYSTTTSGETTPVLGEERRNGKLGRSSPLLKGYTTHITLHFFKTFLLICILFCKFN